MKGLFRLLVCTGALAAAPFAAAQQQQPANSFLQEAARDNMAEVKMADVAQERASSDEVKYYAKQLKASHEVAKERLEEIADNQDVDLPDEPNDQQQQKQDKLSKLEGQQFDRQYLQTMIEGHKKTIQEFEQQAKTGPDQQVRQYAKNNLPALRAHLEMAQQLQQDMQHGAAGAQGAGGAQKE